jgi:hypothetical protein
VTNDRETRVFILTNGCTLANIEAEVRSDVANFCDFKQIKKGSFRGKFVGGNVLMNGKLFVICG